MDLIENAGIFIYPLFACSFLAVFVTIERLISLRMSKALRPDMLDALIRGEPSAINDDPDSVLGRIVAFYRGQSPGADELVAFARVEISKMERGLFLLEVVIGAAPLLGLLGTVTGLTQVFGNFFAENGLTNPDAFIRGIALALNTTIIGLAISIPALAAHAYLLRRIEWLAARIRLGVECLSKSITKVTPDSAS